MVQLHKFSFITNQSQCLGDHKIVENGSRSINMNNFHHSFIPPCRLWILLSHRDFDVFFCFNIVPDTSIYISHDPGSVIGDNKVVGKWL